MGSNKVNFSDRPLIMIIDDTPQNLQLIGTALNSRGYDVELASGGEKAIKQVEHSHPDLILLDVMMPDIDGFELCRRFHKNPDTREIPIIFISARNSTNDVVKGLGFGAVDYITKPINLTELFARINTHLELKASRDELRQARDTIRHISEDRRELLHILCHDLANPVNSIIACLSIAQDKPEFMNDDTRAEMLKVARHSMDVIDQVRELRSLEDRKNRLDINAVKLQEAISDAASILQNKLSEKQIKLDIDIPEHLEVFAERISLVNSIINNLLTNSIKFSYPESKVKISTRKEESHIFLIVEDHGIGIPEHLQENMFKLGVRCSRRGTNGEIGTGYGLPLVHKFMIAYGGNIEVESKSIEDFPEDHGTTIRLKFRNART